MEETFVTNIIGNFPNLKFLLPILEGHNGFIAGGCFKQIFSGEKIKDVDIFFESEKDWLFTCNFFNEKGWEVRYENEKVIAFQDYEHKFWIELICTIYGSPKFILDNFDFTVTKFALYKNPLYKINGASEEEFKVVYHKDFFEHLTTKRLVIDNQIPFPISTWERSYRYARKYGYTLCRESKKRLLESLRGTDPTKDDKEVGLYGGWD